MLIQPWRTRRQFLLPWTSRQWPSETSSLTLKFKWASPLMPWRTWGMLRVRSVDLSMGRTSRWSLSWWTTATCSSWTRTTTTTRTPSSTSPSPSPVAPPSPSASSTPWCPPPTSTRTPWPWSGVWSQEGQLRSWSSSWLREQDWGAAIQHLKPFKTGTDAGLFKSFVGTLDPQICQGGADLPAGRSLGHVRGRSQVHRPLRGSPPPVWNALHWPLQVSCLYNNKVEFVSIKKQWVWLGGHLLIRSIHLTKDLVSKYSVASLRGRYQNIFVEFWIVMILLSKISLYNLKWWSGMVPLANLR